MPEKTPVAVPPGHLPSAGEYFAPLEGLRGLAVLLVVIYHTAYFNHAVPWQRVLNSITKAWHIGVPIFFTLSGFLIAHSVLRAAERFDWRAYAVRRVAKIFPPFVLSLIVFGIWAALEQGPKGVWSSAFAYLTTWANFSPPAKEVNAVLWSLLIEIHFYVVWPLVFFGCARVTRQPGWVALGIVALVPPLMRVVWPPTLQPGTYGPYLWYHQMLSFPLHLDAFAPGILFALLYQRADWREGMRRWAPTMVAMGMLLLLAATGYLAAVQHQVWDIYFGRYGAGDRHLFEFQTLVPGWAAFGLLFSVLLPAKSLWVRLFTFAPLAWLGLVSYEWYLFHGPPVQTLQHVVGGAGGNWKLYLLRTALPAGGSLLFSALVYYFYSEPILRWAKRWLASRRATG